MKAERRHELRDNDLAHYIEAGRDYLSEYGTRVGVLAFVVVAVILVVGITVRSRATALEDAWQRMSTLEFTDDVEVGKRSLETLAALTKNTDHPGIILTALMEQGRQALRLAHQVDAPPGRELNETAREAFEQLLVKFADNPLAFGAAHCGLATVEENAFVLDADLAHKERAAGHLQAVIDNAALASMPFASVAHDRQLNLDKVFTVVRFEVATPEQLLAKESQSQTATATPVSAGQVPPRIMQKVEVQPDGTLKVIETKER